MRTTNKEYQEKAELRKECRNQADTARITGDHDTAYNLDEKRDDLQKNYFDKLDTTSVSYMIGQRSYYGDVIKIGKTYFSNGRKMTQSNGFYCIEEIPEVTEQMTKEMIADSYYY